MREIGARLRSVRRARGLSLRELAVRAEVSASMLSQIENGRAYPSVRSLHSIADALRVPINHFFPRREGQVEESTSAGLTASEMAAQQFGGQAGPPRPASATGSMVMRAANRPRIELRGGVAWNRLTEQPEAAAEYLEINYQPGASSGARMSHHIGREFGYVLEGELTLELGFEKHCLSPGDSVIFDSMVPHRLTNQGDGPLRALWVVMKECPDPAD